MSQRLIGGVPESLTTIAPNGLPYLSVFRLRALPMVEIEKVRIAIAENHWWPDNTGWYYRPIEEQS